MRDDLMNIYFKMMSAAEKVVHLWRNDVVLWDLIYLATLQPTRFYWLISSTGSHIGAHYPFGIEVMLAAWNSYNYKAEAQYFVYDVNSGIKAQPSDKFAELLTAQHRKDLELPKAKQQEPHKQHQLPALPPPLAKAIRKLTSITHAENDRHFYVNQDELARAEKYLQIMAPATFWAIWQPPHFHVYTPNHPFTLMTALDDAAHTWSRAFIYENQRLREVDQQTMQTLIAGALDPKLFALAPVILTPPQPAIPKPIKPMTNGKDVQLSTF